MNNFWKDKKVLVTGAGGFIGSQLVESLLAEGAHVRAFVRYNSRADSGLLRLVPQELGAALEVVGGDLREWQAVRQVVRGCEIVFHLGALISIPYSYHHPLEVAETNFMGTLNILMACQYLDVQRLIHTSTSEVYGTARRVPIDESHPLQGQSPYSASKIGADKMAESFYCSYDLPVVTVRPFNTYGPRQSGRAVIPTIISQALLHKAHPSGEPGYHPRLHLCLRHGARLPVRRGGPGRGGRCIQPGDRADHPHWRHRREDRAEAGPPGGDHG